MFFVLSGCEGTVGPCAGQNCPTVPGCQQDENVVCDSDHVCDERVCEGVGWICGEDSEGKYAWLRKKAPCSDNNACTKDDICLAGQCVGTPLDCNTPPGRVCTNSTTLTTYATAGACKAGKCGYTTSSITCGGGCKGGQCVGDPCKGVKCDNPPGPCHKAKGSCSGGKCSYLLNPVGTPCTLKDKCTVNATCDSAGKCTGGKVDCSRAHTSGGTCVSGVCQGFKCVSGWGNCNTSWSDGCEASLSSTSNCGGCKKKCGGVANGSPSCVSGRCKAVCRSPHKDCDGKFANGCEIPVGVANKCSKSGLGTFSGSTPPCGTAHCGSSTASKTTSFGSWHCKFCSHCSKMPDGKYAWCLYSGSSKGKFSPSRCTTCCKLNDPKYPVVCK